MNWDLLLTAACGFLFGLGINKELNRPHKPYWPIGRKKKP